MKKKNKKRWKDYLVRGIIGLIAIFWLLLIKEGDRLSSLPSVKRLIETTPMWIIILNLVLWVSSAVLLTVEKILSGKGKALTFIIFTFSFVFFSITAVRLPSILVPILGVTLWIGWIVGKSIDNKRDKEKRKKE
jgi:cytochrome bd-type quinol oxidase subunit 2